MSRMSGGAKARMIRSALRLARESKGMSVRELATAVSDELAKDPTTRRKSVSASTISAWENDTSQPKQDEIAAWCRALNLVYDPVIYSSADERVPVLLRPVTMRLARTADLLPQDEVDVLADMAERLLAARS